MTILYIILGLLSIVAIRDIFFNKKHSIQHNYPLVGHIRYMLEKIGPELRQYWVANDTEELPFSREWRNWIYRSSKVKNNMTGFGTASDFNKKGHIIIKNDMFPFVPKNLEAAKKVEDILKPIKIIGPNRKKPYYPTSIINISGMSFGALSGPAVESLNKGAKIAGCYQNTGEGGFSKFHNNGADVIFQIGTGYFGVCDDSGKFSMEKLIKLVEENPCIKAIEIKLSQGAKPGKGGILPAEKMTDEIAKARGLIGGQAAISPAMHSEFSDIVTMIVFIEKISKVTGLPVGIKSSVGNLSDWEVLAETISITNEGPDFITIDGGEGGTGAAPASFTDHLSLPFDLAFYSVKKIFEERRMNTHTNKLNEIVFIGSAKLGLPGNAIKAFAMGVDMINVAREALMSIGCIQAQRCHTNKCPTGIATQNKWLQKGVDPTDKAERCANYIKTLRKEIKELTHASGKEHPSQFKMEDVLIQTGSKNGFITLDKYFKNKNLL